MKDFTVDYSKFRINKILYKQGFWSDNLSDKSLDEETIPDEEFDKIIKMRDKLPSCPSITQKGPNINLKIQHKRFSNQKEREFFFAKIKRKKKTELCKNYEMYHDCFYKEECCFAHGMEELRENAIFSGYKTKMCKSFQENNFCNFGKRCSYMHKIK